MKTESFASNTDLEMEGETTLSYNDDQFWNPRSLSHLYASEPLIINDATLYFEPKESSKNYTMDFTPPKYVQDMHAAPRFGHTNRIGQLTSSNPEDALDYAGGLKQFSLFVVVPFIIWAIILVLFKFLYGIPKIGCAAGGEVLDMKQLSKQGISRKQRKKRILRSWRLHTTFMICGVLVPTTSLIMMRNGWSKVQLAWDDVQEVVDDVEGLALRGWNVLEGLQDSRDVFSKNKLVRGFLEYAQSDSASPFLSKWCPNAKSSSQLSFLNEAMASLQDQTASVVELFDDYVPVNSQGFLRITDATHSVDESLQWFFDNDWIWKMYIMILNVLVVFLLLCVYIFSKNNIIHPPTRFYLTFFVVPLFTVATGLLLIATATSGVATLMNADFCAGGSGSGSPQGTIRDAIVSYFHGSISPTREMTGKLGLVYNSFNYYAEGCLSEPPLQFIGDYSQQIDSATAYLVDLSQNMPNTPETLDLLNSECGSDMSVLLDALVSLETDLVELQRFMHTLVDMVSCHSISPLIRRLTHGAVCSESARGLTWIWGCSLFITLCCFVMLTTRAALYNAIMKRKKRETKPKRVVEKEFEEYKEFMQTYYEDAAEWKLHGDKKRTGILEIDFGQHIQSIPTLETERMSSGSDNLSEGAGILGSPNTSSSSAGDDQGTDVHPELVEGSDRLILSQDDLSDSYDSDYESDSDLSEASDGGDDESALISFYTETKSILSETKSILSEAKSKLSIAVSRAASNLRSLKPLLGKTNDDAESSQGEESVTGKIVSLQSPQVAARNTAADNNYITPQGAFSILGLKTPSAPLKPFSFLGRTAVKQADHNEVEPLTNTPPRISRSGQFCTEGQTVQPRRLMLSPDTDSGSMGKPQYKTQRAEPSRGETGNYIKESRRESNPETSMRWDLVQMDPERRHALLTGNTIIRPRLDSDDSSIPSQVQHGSRAPPTRRPSFLNLMTRQRCNSDDSSVISIQELDPRASAESHQAFCDSMTRPRSDSDSSSVCAQIEPCRRRPSFLSRMTRKRTDSDDSSVLAQLEPGQRAPEGRPSFLNRMARKRTNSEDSSVLAQLEPDASAPEGRPLFRKLLTRQRANPDAIHVRARLDSDPRAQEVRPSMPNHATRPHTNSNDIHILARLDSHPRAPQVFNRTTRPRIDSDGSNDISLYIEDMT